ncbi:MAG: metal-dependent transcriptional regulator [Acidobacteriota bacterium]
MISRAMEDYLKAIYELSTEGERVSTSKLAQRMACSAASATNMVQKLSALKLVEYTPYQGVLLTAAGSKIALETLRHHRLIELYLLEVLGYSWDEVHAEADELEHVISEEFEDRIDRALGYPTRDPHGHPIPTRDGQIAAENASSLWDSSEGQQVVVQRVSDRDPEALRYLASLGIYPEVKLGIIGKAPFNGPVQIEIGNSEHSLSEELARQIYVIPKGPDH